MSFTADRPKNLSLPLLLYFVPLSSVRGFMHPVQMPLIWISFFNVHFCEIGADMMWGSGQCIALAFYSGNMSCFSVTTVGVNVHRYVSIGGDGHNGFVNNRGVMC